MPSEVIKMTVTGNAARDAQRKVFNSGKPFIEIRLAASQWNYSAQMEETRWFDVTVTNPSEQDYLMNNVGKGSKLLVIGDHYTREYEGKTYESIKQATVKIMAKAKAQLGIDDPVPQPSLDGDDIPF